jgi:hypothetical protein
MKIMKGRLSPSLSFIPYGSLVVHNLPHYNAMEGTRLGILVSWDLLRLFLFLINDVLRLVDLCGHVGRPSPVRVVEEHHLLVALAHLLRGGVWGHAQDEGGLPLRHRPLEPSPVILCVLPRARVHHLVRLRAQLRHGAGDRAAGEADRREAQTEFNHYRTHYG